MQDLDEGGANSVRGDGCCRSWTNQKWATKLNLTREWGYLFCGGVSSELMKSGSIIERKTRRSVAWKELHMWGSKTKLLPFTFLTFF